MREYRRYEPYEPDDVQRPGVYYQRDGAAPNHHAVLYYVPPFLSPAFWEFFAEFTTHPGDNPVFLREWRRHYRRVGGAGAWWRLAGVFIGLLSGLAGIALLILVNPFLAAPWGEALVAAIFFLPSFAMGLLGFFLGLRSCSLAWNRATLLELALTGIGAQEIVFGHLLGGVLPFVLPLVAAMPGVLVVGLDLMFRTHLIGTPTLFGMIVFLVPNAAASLLCSASIAAALSFSEGDTGRSLLMPALGWVVVAVAVLAPISFYMYIAHSYALLIGVPVLIAAKLLVTGAFLQHLAHRVIRIEEE